MRTGSLSNPDVLYWRLVALIAYPTIVLMALMLNEPRLRALTFPLLALALVGPLPWGWGKLAIVLSATAIGGAIVIEPALALWPPGLICLVAAAAFGISLLPGRKPLLEQYAEALPAPAGPPLPVGAPAWLRQWTKAWALSLLILGTGAVILAANSMTGWWLIWVAVLMPIVSLSLLVGEFHYRRLRFPNHPHPSLAGFLWALLQVRAGQISP